MGESNENKTLERELKWLLEEQVHKDLTEIHSTIMLTLKESYREQMLSFLFKDNSQGELSANRKLSILVAMVTEQRHDILSARKIHELNDRQCRSKSDGFCRSHLIWIDTVFKVDQTLVKSQRNLLSSPNNTGQIKCVVTLAGDAICDADISFKHKAGKDHHIFKTKIQPDRLSWKLHQVQDSANHLATTLSIISAQDPDHVYKSATEVILVNPFQIGGFSYSKEFAPLGANSFLIEKLPMQSELLEDLLKFLTLGRTCLAFPKRKSIEELIRNNNMQSFVPPVPNDVALSFYIHSSKLILTVYHLHITSHQVEIVSRHQVECTVQWLNEAVILYTLAIQQCQQLLDKLKVLEQQKVT